MALGITVDINANLVRLEGQIDRSVEQFRRFQDSAESHSAKINSALSSIGIGLSIGGIAAFIKSGIDAADALNDMADRTGIAIEKLAGFEFAVSLGDTSMEAFTQAANKLSIGIAKNGEELKQLGISAKDPADAFLQFADVFSSIEDDQKRAAFGAQVLGKSYAEMAPLLAMGAERIHELVKQGQEMSGVTEEQAQAAGKFNDQLDILSARSLGLRTKIALGILEPLVAMAEEMDKSIEKTGKLQGSLAGLSNEYRDLAENASIALGAMAGLRFGPLGAVAGAAMGYSLGKQLTKSVDDEIAFLQKKIKTMETEGFLGKLIDDATGQDINLAKNQLERLLKLKHDLAKPEPKKEGEDPAQNKPPISMAAIDRFLSKGENPEEKAAKASAKAEESRLKAVNETIAALRMDIDISGLSEAQQRRMLELSSSLKNAKGGEIQVITDLVNKKYADIEASQRQQAQWAQLIEDANAYYDLRKEIDSLSKTDLSLDSFGTGLDKIQSQLNEGIINEGQAKALFDQLGRAYNDSFIDPAKIATDDLSAYAEQAARNMQDSFADFLFDPFQEGADGMLTSFLSTIQRMAAEYASSEIFDLFRNKDQGGAGLGSAIGSGLSSFLGGLFHDGGVVGYGGGTAAIPFPAAAFAPAYHTGGIAGLQPDEMIAKLRIGEEVLTRSDPRHRWNNPPAAGTEVQAANVTVINNFTLNQPADRRTQDQIAAMAGNSIKRALQRNG